MRMLINVGTYRSGGANSRSRCGNPRVIDLNQKRPLLPPKQPV